MRCSIGPRQATATERAAAGSVGSHEHPDRDHLHAVRDRRQDHLVDPGRPGGVAVARRRGRGGPGSRTRARRRRPGPTERPRAASATARLAVIVDLPTPPLPLVIAMTRVRRAGAERVAARGAPAAQALGQRARARSGVITDERHVDRAGARDGLGGLRGRRVRCGRLPGSRRSSAGCRRARAPSSSTDTASTMSSSVIGLRISGSITAPSAARTAVSRSGRGMLAFFLVLAVELLEHGAQLGADEVLRRPCRCIARRSATTSRARYSVSARLRSARWRSCSICTRSRSSWRFWASRIRGAAYEACSERIRVSAVNPIAIESNRSGSGANVFHAIQAIDEHRQAEQEARGAHAAGDRLGEAAEPVAVARSAEGHGSTRAFRGVEPAVLDVNACHLLPSFRAGSGCCLWSAGRAPRRGGPLRSLRDDFASRRAGGSRGRRQWSPPRRVGGFSSTTGSETRL